jgi:hypothetical protein
MVVASLIAVFALGAVVAGPALAKKAHVPGTLEGEWKPYAHCPIDNSELINPPAEFDGRVYSGNQNWCYYGYTAGGKEGGSFTVGGVTVPLNKKIKIQGGVDYYEGPEGESYGHVIPAEGAETLEAPLLTVPKGINLITPAIQAEANWPRSLEESFDYAKVHHETKLSAHIVVAGGNLLYEEEDALNTTALLERKGPTFTLPLRVVLNGPWLESLGGGQCTIGTEEHPIYQHLTSGVSEAPAPYEANTQEGFAGHLHFNPEFTNLVFKESTLVDSTWPVEVPAEGCGGTYESYVDAAISKVLDLPAPAGSSVTVLKGTLGTGEAATVLHEREFGTER